VAKTSRYQVDWTASAEQDLTAMVDYLSTESVLLAEKVLSHIYDRAHSLVYFPFRMRIVPELLAHGVERYRELLVDPYRIFCVIEGSHVRVLAVFDGRRDVEELLLQRLMAD